MADLLYDYYPSLSAAKEAKKRVERKGYRAAIRKVFMSDMFVLYIKSSKHESSTRFDDDRRRY